MTVKDKRILTFFNISINLHMKIFVNANERQRQKAKKTTNLFCSLIQENTHVVTCFLLLE